MTIPNSKNWLAINYVINAIRRFLPSFYIFEGKKLCNDYIQLWKLRTCMDMQTKTWMINCHGHKNNQIYKFFKIKMRTRWHISKSRL